MSRLPFAMLACLVFGAGGMWLASNFKVKFEPIAGPDHPAPAPVPAEKPAAPAEPALLPGHIVSRPAAPAPAVQQAAALQPAPLVLAPQVVGADPVKRTEETPEVAETIDTQTIVWGRPASALPLATDNPTLKLAILPKDDAKPRVFLTGTQTLLEINGVYSATAGTLQLNLASVKDAFAPGKSIALTIVRTTTDAVESSASVTLIRALPNDGQFTVDKASTTKGLATKDLPLTGPDANIVNEYVRFQGTGLGTFAGASFFVIVDGKPSDPNAATRVLPQVRQEVWEYELLTKPFATGASGRFLVKAEFAGGHIFALAKGALAFTKNFNAIPAPTLTLAKATSIASDSKFVVGPAAKSATTGLNTVNANTRLLKATVVPDSTAKAVALYVDTKLIGIKERAASVEFNELEIGEGREHLVRAESILGNAASPAAQVAVKVVTTPPRIDAVVAPGFGQSNGAGTETIRIRFSAGNPLERTTAEAKDNFEVLSGNTADSESRLLNAPVFDEATNTVTLTPNKIVPGSYVLRVKPAVLDIYGNALFTVPGTKATYAFETTLYTSGPPAEAALPSQSAGVTLSTGPNAVFPEYTKFRDVADGFNPSDRVETRVVRLYYARDAHRVAQIVNRDVKSFNVQSVDVRRRVADRVRDDANGLQDERQRLERAAVQAAVATRIAENEVKQLEGKLQAARGEQGNSRVQITQREQQLAVAQRELDRSLAATADRAATDPLVAQQRTFLDTVTDPTARQAEQSKLALLIKEADARADRQNEPLRTTVRSLTDEAAKLRQVQSTAAASELQLQDQLVAARAKVQGLRATELTATESALGKDGEERRKREDQFRREVAAALADPDTYAAGKPDSVDPVLQCSIAVIGEGLIQIRGPVKGLNVIRTMINQIDAPVGQVRVGVHTVQVNGARVDRMDKVVNNIQHYLDHSRFLTTQSAQMLRKAVTTVASRKAVEAGQTIAPGCTQADRDAKYLHCFFGKDFIDELKLLDSEFLKTGNKILSLHSMDSTSLSSALFLMALAKNDIREEILAEFQAQLQTKLPEEELKFFLQGLSCATKCEAHSDKAFCVLSKNAQFASFLGFFNTEVQGTDTLTPIQREFIRLAQIFKARMVTEIELKQRVMERTLLEDRVGNFREEQKKAKAQEVDAREKRLAFQVKLQTSIAEAATAFGQLESQLDAIEQEFQGYEALLKVLESLENLAKLDAKNTPQRFLGTERVFPVHNGTDLWFKKDEYKWITDSFTSAVEYFRRFYYIDKANYDKYVGLAELLGKMATDRSATTNQLSDARRLAGELFKVVRGQIAFSRAEIAGILEELRKDKPNINGLLTRYSTFRQNILAVLRDGEPLKETVKGLFSDKVGPAFLSLQTTFVATQAADRTAALSRRPLDEKKLLDMLVDDMEDKYIELLDGTRAHTANVDNYLKALSTALDDDFAKQFYAPAFSKIRTLGASWDVQLGQIESTTVLTNNRGFGKVSPTATMEFDVPNRDILLKEAMKSAGMAVKDYGALLNDPTFLAAVKLFSGNPVGAQFGGLGGLPAVRNILPGLPGSSDETIMAQSNSNRPAVGSNLESIIPDPAIVKFETGVGYEVRPVIGPDGQSVVFTLDYMYTTDIREPVRADEKHLGRVKRHLLHTDVQLGNFELRDVSKYWVSTKVARTGKGVALLQDIPVAGALFRPAPSAGSALQQNLIYSQAAIFPTLFDLMGLRYAPAIADLTPEGLRNDEFVVRGRRDYLRAFIFDYGASRVDDALRIMYGERRPDLYRSQFTIPSMHPNGYRGSGLRQRDSQLEEGYIPLESHPPTKFTPGMHLPPSPEADPYGIPPGVSIPGHPAYGKSEFRAAPLGPPTITRETALPPGSQALPGPRPVPTVAPPVAAPAPLQNLAPVNRTGPVPLPPGQYFPK